MKPSIQLLVAAVLPLCIACGSEPSSPDEGATETNVAPAQCESDEDCPEGVMCVLSEDAGAMGFCDVNETTQSGSNDDTSSAAPAPCSSNADCPDGVECTQMDGAGSPGFCDVDETISD